MKTLHESILDVDDNIEDQSSAIYTKVLDWLKTHHAYSTRFTNSIEKHVNISKDGAVDTDNSDTITGNFSIKLGRNETTLPDYLRFQNLYQMNVRTEAKTIDLSNFGNVENFELVGPNLTSITGVKNLEINSLKILADNVKSMDLEKVSIESIVAHCPKIILNKIKLPRNIQVCWLPNSILTDVIPFWNKLRWMD